MQQLVQQLEPPHETTATRAPPQEMVRQQKTMEQAQQPQALERLWAAEVAAEVGVGPELPQRRASTREELVLCPQTPRRLYKNFL